MRIPFRRKKTFPDKGGLYGKSLTESSRDPILLGMLIGRHFRILWLAGLAFLAVAHATHAFEHWEIAAHKDCVAHTHGDSDHNDGGGSRHDHGCTSHDHAPALMGGIFVLTVSETVALVRSDRRAAPAPRAAAIDHPPQLS